MNTIVLAHEIEDERFYYLEGTPLDTVKECCEQEGYQITNTYSDERKLVNDILDLSKMQADADTLNIEEFDLVEVIHEVMKRYEILKTTEDYKFILTLPEKAVVHADKNKIMQVIYNLVNNAINYTGDDKKVYVTLMESKKEYLFEVRDTGKGIKKEEIPYIWDKYYKSDKKHQRNVVSTGIGLSIVKEILSKHKFDYGVKSVAKKGSTFYFKIKK